MIESFLLALLRFLVEFLLEIVLYYSPARLLRRALSGTPQAYGRQGFMALLWQSSLDILSWGLVLGGIIFVVGMYNR